MTTLDIATPRWAVPLLRPARYKGAHGGRGSGKSHFFAEALVEQCLIKPTRWVCVREVQATIADSVRQLLIDKIRALGVQSSFNVPKDREGNIYAPHGGMIAFRGMQSFNADNIKSLEDFDGAWVEEGQNLSERSLDLLRPTIRKPGSEIWASWNPRFDTDPVDVFFRGPHRHPDAVCVEVNWQDNPWFPDVLRVEMEADYRADPEKAQHIWGGGYETLSEGAYYARYVSSAEAEGRIGAFPHDALRPVITSWDIGVDDYTAIWFWQESFDGRWATVIDYYETQNDGAEQIIRDALPEHHSDVREAAQSMINMERKTPFFYERHQLPHDVKLREWGAGARSRIETLIGLGLRNIRKGAQLGPEERIAASRRLFPMVRFNDTPRVQIGIRRLRRYSRRYNEQMGIWQGPAHDEHSHGCLVAGSMVTMANGQTKPIEAVTAGEKVWTPSGNSLTVWAGRVKFAESIVVLTMRSGEVLACTPEHKILTTMGYVEAGLLSPSATILTGQEWTCRLIAWLSMAFGFGFREAITGERLTAATTCTERFGQRQTVQFQKAITSTTSTGIRLTTLWKTWLASPLASILARTRESLSKMAGLSLRARPHSPRPRNGTKAQRAGSGTLSMERKLGKGANDRATFAYVAAVTISRLILRAPNFALGSAKILSAKSTKGGQWVFDLTVERNATYQANGLMVSNSDAFGEYAVNSPLLDRRPPEPKPFKLQGGVLLQGAPKPQNKTRIRL